MIKHFVRFLSPGTFMVISTDKPIDKWDVQKALKMIDDIEERYGSKPFGFQFVTYSRSDEDLDSKQTKASGIYYVDARIETYEEICARNLKEEEILRWNMKNNGYDKVVTNGPTSKTYRFYKPFVEGDVVLT